MSEVIGEALRKRVDEALMASLTGKTTVVQPEQEPFTLDTLQAMMDRMPPKETWLSSKLFPRGKASYLRTRQENWTVAHPDFWVQLYAHIFALPEDERKSLIGPFSPTVTNIDYEEGDGAATKARKERESKRYADALAWSIRKTEMLGNIRLRTESVVNLASGV